jgi:predicted nucleic acid-binding protein
MMVVADASVALKVLLPELGSDQAHRLFAREAVIAPDLLVAEVANAVWRKVHTGEATLSDGSAIVARLPDLFDEFTPSEALGSDALRLAVAIGHPAYDCFYLALAAP